MAPGEKLEDSLPVRSVDEEFKAFVRHKIQVLERFKNVDELKVYLDALELGLRTIEEIQMEAEEEKEGTEVEFQGAPEILADTPSGVEEEPDIETEELEDAGTAGEGAEEEWALAMAGEVLVGESEEARQEAKAGVEAETEVTAGAEETPEGGEIEGPIFEEEGEESDEENDTSEEKGEEEGEGEEEEKGEDKDLWARIAMGISDGEEEGLSGEEDAGEEEEQEEEQEQE